MELTGSSDTLTWAHVFGQICWRFKTSTGALSDPEIKPLAKNERKHTHTHTRSSSYSVNEHSEGSRGETEQKKRKSMPGSGWRLKEAKRVLGEHSLHTGCVMVMMSAWNTKVWTDIRTKVTVHVCMCECSALLWMDVACSFSHSLNILFTVIFQCHFSGIQL